MRLGFRRGAQARPSVAGRRDTKAVLAEKLRHHLTELDVVVHQENGRLLAMFLRPNGSALAIGGARSFIDRMHEVVNGLHPERYASLVHPGDPYSFDIFSEVAAALRSSR